MLFSKVGSLVGRYFYVKNQVPRMKGSEAHGRTVGRKASLPGMAGRPWKHGQTWEGISFLLSNVQMRKLSPEEVSGRPVPPDLDPGHPFDGTVRPKAQNQIAGSPTGQADALVSPNREKTLRSFGGTEHKKHESTFRT